MRRAARPNDPCPCGSDLKYKKCCGRPAGAAKPAFASFTSGDQATALMKLGDFVDIDRWSEEVERASALFWGEFAELESELPDELLAMSNEVFAGWFGFDYRLDDGRLIVDHLLEDKRLSAGERAYLKAMRETSMRLYEVTEVVPETSITLRDLVENTTITVKDRLASRELGPHSCLAARVIGRGHTGGPELELGLLPIEYDKRDILIYEVKKLRANVLEHEKADTTKLGGAPSASGAEPSPPQNKVDEAMPPLFHKAWLSAIVQVIMNELRSEGDPMVLTQVSFHTSNADAVAQALDAASAHGIEAYDDGVWSWTGAKTIDGEAGVEPTTLGTFELSDDTLILKTTSIGRAARGRALIESLAGAHLQHRETTEKRLDALLNQQATALASSDEQANKPT